MFQKTGTKVPVQARFSTVIHPRGSPESLRDVRGFTVRFQTEEGNWDLVGALCFNFARTLQTSSSCMARTASTAADMMHGECSGCI